MSKKANMMTGLDKVIAYFSPQSALDRLVARTRLSYAGGYKSGDRNRLAFKYRGISNGSADEETLDDLPALRSDSHDLQRKEPLAKGAINTVVTNVVGTGLMPQSTPDKGFLLSKGISEEEIAQFELEAERLFKNWSKKEVCDASRSQSFRGLQALALRSQLVSGDVFAVRKFKPTKRSPLQSCLQMIEADRVDNPAGQKQTANFAAGIERDNDGAPLKYHILRTHPGARYAAKRETTAIDAFYSNGEQQVYHVFKRERPEQSRGVPFLAPVIDQLMQLGKYTEAEIQAAVISGAFTVFVTSEGGEEGGLPSNMSGAGAAPVSNDDVKMGNGLIVDLDPGEKVEFANPNRPNTAFDPFVQAVLRQIGVALEIPFEILIKHFTASYSAAQAAIVEAWKFFKSVRAFMEDHFCQPVYESVIAEAVARGILVAPGFLLNPDMRAAWCETMWIGSPRGQIDPLKEAKANTVMEERGWKTAAEITAEVTGGDWDKKHERRAKEEQKRRDAGLALEPQSNAIYLNNEVENESD